MNFYNQYKDLFQVGNISFGQRERLRLDNQLFIDRPFVPAYSKEYELSSKLRELNRDYNDFQSQVRELQELSQIPKRSNSRRKQTYQNTKNNQPLQNSHLRHRKGNNIEQHYMQRQQDNQLNVSQKRHYQKSTIFDHYQDNQSLNGVSHHKHKIDQRQLRPKQQQQYKYQRRQQYNMESSLPQKYVQNKRNSIQYQQKRDGLQHQQKRNHNLQSLRRENDMNAQKLISSQNILANKMYHEQNNNILKQSEINHVFNWKLQQQQNLLSPQQIKQSTIPKYKLNNPTLQVSSPNQIGGNKGFRNNNNNNNWNEGNSVNKRNNREQNMQGNNYPSSSNSQQMSALQRRRIAKQKIDERRQKLKAIIKSYF